MKTFADLEATLVALEDTLLVGAQKVHHPPFFLAYRQGNMLIVRDTENGDLPNRDIVFNGWRVYNMKQYHVNDGHGNYVTPSRVLSPNLADAQLFDTEDEACEVCTQELAERLNVILTVDEL